MVTPYGMPLDEVFRNIFLNTSALVRIFTATASSCQIYLSSLAFLCVHLVCTHFISWIFYFNLILNYQIKAHQAECVKAMEGVLKDLLATQDQEVLRLLKEAAEQEKGKYYSFMVRTHFLNCSFIPQR